MVSAMGNYSNGQYESKVWSKETMSMEACPHLQAIYWCFV